jgi:hypothetical protein
VLAAVALGAVAATPRGQAVPPPLSRPYAATLPEGQGREIAESGCLMCHTATLITQQAKDSLAWSKTVATMMQWGAPVKKGDRDELVHYLSAHLGPRTKP